MFKRKNNFVYLSSNRDSYRITGDLLYDRGIHFHSKWRHASAHDARFRGILFLHRVAARGINFPMYYNGMLIHGDAYRLNGVYIVRGCH